MGKVSPNAYELVSTTIVRQIKKFSFIILLINFIQNKASKNRRQSKQEAGEKRTKLEAKWENCSVSKKLGQSWL